MRTDRRILLATVAVATMAIGACGGAGQPSASSRVLSLMENTGAGAEPAIYPQPTFTYVLDGPLANLGPDAAVRTLVGHDVTTADLGRIIGALGMHGAPVRTDTGWELRNGDAVLTVWTNSGLTTIDYSSAGGAVAIASLGSRWFRRECRVGDPWLEQPVDRSSVPHRRPRR